MERTTERRWYRVTDWWNIVLRILCLPSFVWQIIHVNSKHLAFFAFEAIVRTSTCTIWLEWFVSAFTLCNETCFVATTPLEACLRAMCVHAVLSCVQTQRHLAQRHSSCIAAKSPAKKWEQKEWERDIEREREKAQKTYTWNFKRV